MSSAEVSWRWTPPAGCLDGRVILVTGAGDGIGREAALTFARYGAHVVLLGRTRQKLEAVFDEIEANTQTQPVIVPADLAHLNDEAANALFEAIADTYGRLDGILHNASLLGPKVPMAHFPTDDWHRVMAVNSFAPFLLTRTLLPLLEAAPSAMLLYTSSSVGHKGRAYWGAYAVSKFAQEGFMQTLADELEKTSNIVVASVNPGGTRTPMRAAAYPAEDPQTVPPPSAHMDLYLHLFANTPRDLHGAALDARTWQGPGADS